MALQPRSVLLAGAAACGSLVLATAAPGLAAGAAARPTLNPVQANLQTALTAAKTWYTQNNQSYDGFNPSTFKQIDTGLTAVAGKTPSTRADVISLHVAGSDGEDVILAASASAGATCWAIADLTGSHELDGFTGPGTLYIEWPKPRSGACDALDFNRLTKPAGASTSTNGFPPLAAG